MAKKELPTIAYGHELWVMTERTRLLIQMAEMSHSLRDGVRSSVTREELRVEPQLLHIAAIYSRAMFSQTFVPFPPKIALEPNARVNHTCSPVGLRPNIACGQCVEIPGALKVGLLQMAHEDHLGMKSVWVYAQDN